MPAPTLGAMKTFKVSDDLIVEAKTDGEEPLLVLRDLGSERKGLSFCPKSSAREGAMKLFVVFFS
jgi:hypothetical protein